MAGAAPPGLGLAVTAAVLAGLLPALRASRIDPIRVINSAGARSSVGRGDRRLLRRVTLFQTALTLTLLVGAGLLIRTMMNLAKVHSGYDTGHILTMSVTAVQGDWFDFHRRALDRVSALPGVQHAAFAWGVPLTGNSWPGAVEIEGQPPASKPSDMISLPLRSVTPEYFQLLGQPIVDGRDFRTTDDRKAPPVAIVNQTLVDRYFPHANPIGKKLWLFSRQQPPSEIIGVVANSRTDDLTHGPQPEVYLSLWQAGAFSKHLIIRTAADPRPFAAMVERELRSIDPTVAIENVKTLEPDPQRFTGVTDLRHAVARGIFAGGKRADARRNLWRARALRGFPAARDRHSHGSRSGAPRHTEPCLRRRVSIDRRWSRCGPRCRADRISRAKGVFI